ncbi:PREDICTED: cap-specific mRNA (nucleoside-2'-O-)-methyltransferase 1-like [Papilio xuthus]|uniref:Cap-specific mRNA (nucleoside-2'-O-)-methyltransferase 1 n=1 Tax=Papilio xuthus TaxID=66420 RepID=A0AAJ6Z4I1_PAPXU|nr:PREDICTED: cap-specific mRNA (nucleoside-2'-O-)-methyltransferase 1-like [Papilio xuthus]
MNSDPTSDDDSSSDVSSVPAKRARTDTFGASSTTSHGSVLPDSDDDDETPDAYDHSQATGKKLMKKNYTEQSPEGNLRLSRSSLSENCSSPNEQYDDFRPGFDSVDTDNENVDGRPSFASANDNTFYNKNSDHSEIIDSGKYSEKSKRMMSNMGFKPGKGLGKFEHGRVEPIEASTQKGKRGLGFQASVVGEAPKDFQWSPDTARSPSAVEEVLWLPSSPSEPLSGAVLQEWLQIGPKKLTIEDETNFVEPRILQGILKSKTIFNNLDYQDLKHARFRSNPYETIGAVIFLNRAAVKMANMDAVFDFMFTKPTKLTGEPAVGNKDLLYFADVCAGPGGFSEYVLYRKGWRAKGFGFTLKGTKDFKLSDFYAGTPETFNPYYGVKEDGNIFDPANLTSLKDFVLSQTDDQGVHFLMADGGFSVEGQENIQEILSKQLYLCQCIAALMLVRTGGNFVVKLFDVFTQFSVSLIYIMYRCFEKVSIHKPVTSRPANSERYLVCKWKKSGTESVEQHLFSVNSMLWRELDKEKDITSLVPLSVLQEDTEFFEYIYKSNCMLGENQIENLLKIAAFSKDKNLVENSQATMRSECLKLWQLPDKVRTQPERLNPDETMMRILNGMDKRTSDAPNAHSFKSVVLSKQPAYLEKISDIGILSNVYDWHFTFLSSEKNSNDTKMFLGCGGKRVFQLDKTGWRNLGDLQTYITLPPKTLFYGELAKEYCGQGLSQHFSKAIHVIDALMLGGIDISHMSLTDRINQCNLFCTAIEKYSGDLEKQSSNVALRCKRFFNMENFASVVCNLEYRTMKRGNKVIATKVPMRSSGKEKYYVVGSVLFMKEIRDPWKAQISKSQGCKYYFKLGKDREQKNEFHLLGEARLDMLSTYASRVLWPWEAAAIPIFEGQPKVGISRVDMEEYISKNMIR